MEILNPCYYQPNYFNLVPFLGAPWRTDCIENIVEKGEIAHFEQFHFISAMFS